MKLSTGPRFSKLQTPLLLLLLVGLQLLLCCCTIVHAWSSPNTNTQSTPSSTSSTTSSATTTTSSSSRRGFFQQGAIFTTTTTTATVVSSWLLIPPLLPVHAAATTTAASAALPTTAELERLRKGLSRVQYLLLHWDEETQICGKVVMSDTERKQVIRTEGGGSGGCEKTPLKVQDFMGYKSTTDPLYRVDKLMVRAAPLVDPEDFENYLQVVEQYKDKADNTAMMAYTSSWGEANPNGGKEVIDEYLERTKEDVMESEKYLKQIVVQYLKLEPLTPMKNPK